MSGSPLAGHSITLGDQSLLFVEDSGVGFDERGSVGNGDDLVKGLSRQLGGEPRVNSSKTGSSFRYSFLTTSMAGHRESSCRHPSASPRWRCAATPMTKSLCGPPDDLGGATDVTLR
jgi:hypothetical protein